MTRGDRILIFVLALLAVAAIPAISMAVGGSGSGIVIDGPYGRSVIDPDRDATILVEGLQGDVVVAIDGGSVRVIDSTCPDRLCVHTPPVGSEGGVIACVPNGVTITVGRQDEGGLDAVVR